MVVIRLESVDYTEDTHLLDQCRNSNLRQKIFIKIVLEKLKKILSLSLFALIMFLMVGCSTTKSKSDIKGIKKLYHNTTSKFNGYFNAQELMTQTKLELDASNENNYNKILPVFDYLDLENPTAIAPNMDKAIEKVITVATIHDFSHYVDDCYVLMGQAQYMKQDYASAEETFQFFEEEFDPLNPYGREYSKAKFKRKSPKEARKELDAKKKENNKEREAKQKEKDEQRKIEEKAREAERKAREKRTKSKKKKGRSKKRPTKRPTKEEVAEKKLDPKTTTKEERDAAKEVEAASAEAKAEAERYEKEKQKLKEEEAAKKEKEGRPQGEGAVFKNKTAYYEGLYWLARTYIETERYSSAKNILDRLDNTNPLNEDLSNKLPAVKAHMLIRTGEMEEALLELDKAIDLEKDKQLRARYAFIKGQIYEQQDNAALAYTEYKRAKKLSPDYEMKFNAELNELKLSYKTGQTSKDKALARLEKMGKEAKNQNFLDQLYFTQGQVKLNSNDIEGAIADFNEAVSASGSGNKNVKLEANYKLAELLYAQGYYREAKKNYDAAVKGMALTDERYKSAKRLAENLTDVAKNIEIVALQDSLLRMSMLSEGELRDIATEKIEERKASGVEPDAKDKRQSNIFSAGNNRLQGSGKSNFFVYNPVALNQGKSEFKKAWGTRVLEDNWRRSLRADVGDNIAEQENEEEVEETVTDEEISAYLRDIPTSDTQKRAANIKIQSALFQLGILFRERLRNYKRSIESLERLVREYPDFEKRDEALFYLYLSYQDLGDNTNATLIKNKLKTEFPDSNYTKLANDPSYAAAMKQDEGNINTYYDRTYKLFENRKYEAVLERSKEKGTLFKGETVYDARFDLLTAMSIGATEGKDEYVKQLQNLIRKHKNTPEEVRAKEILRFLKGDQEAFNEILYDESKDNFSLDDNKLHYIFVVVYDKDQKEMQNLKIAISDYNKKYHRRDNLKISNISLNPESKSQIILIRSYNEGKVPAMAYYNGVIKNEKEFITRQNGDQPKKKVDFDIYVATQKNYREIVKQRSVNEYRVFFEKEYLGK